MSDITRSESIKQLHRLKADIIHGLAFVSKTKDKHLALESLDMAIASLETDEAYDLEYELTKNDLGVDAIARAEVNQVIEDYMNEQFHVLSDRTRERAFGAIAVKARINELSSVTPQEPRWIPVNERLPEDSGEYLVSVVDEEDKNSWYKQVEVVWFAHKKDYDIKESEWRELGIDETVIAWMPLPTPYEPQKSEDKE